MLYDRWESTLQTYRRRATLRIIPDNQALQIEVVVLKELEDVARPAYATAGAATLRHDSSPDRRTEPEPVLGRQVGDDPRPWPMLVLRWGLDSARTRFAARARTVDPHRRKINVAMLRCELVRSCRIPTMDCTLLLHQPKHRAYSRRMATPLFPDCHRIIHILACHRIGNQFLCRY